MILFDALLSLSQVIARPYNGTATGGSVTTLVDTNNGEQNDWFNGGTIFFKSGANANKTAVITDWNSQTKTFTIPTQTGACASGNVYAAVHKVFTRDDMVRAINSALAEIGACVQINSTLTGVSGTTSYTLPAGVYNVKRVSVDGAVNYFWNEVNGSLIFDSGKEPGEAFDVWYQAAHAEVTTDSGTISASIDPARLLWTATYYAALSRYARTNEDNWKDLITVAQNRMTELAQRRPVHSMNRDAHLLGV